MEVYAGVQIDAALYCPTYAMQVGTADETASCVFAAKREELGLTSAAWVDGRSRRSGLSRGCKRISVRRWRLGRGGWACHQRK
jgi:hypothetical protein